MNSALRDVLIAHIDGAVPYSHWDRTRQISLRSALSHGLLECEWSMVPAPSKQKRPAGTVLTEKGRAALTAALADWADALSRAGFDRKAAVAGDAVLAEAAE